MIHKITSPNSRRKMFNPRKLRIFFFYFSLLFSQFAVSHPQASASKSPLASLSLSGSRSLSYVTPPQVLNTSQQVWEFLCSSWPAASWKPGTPNRTSQQSTILNTVNRLEFLWESENLRIL